MGAETFFVRTAGKTASEAFNAAVENAQHDHGHRGYTGTIAEKSGCGFVMIKMPMQAAPDADEKDVFKAARQYAESLIDESDERVDDKGGPAGCIEYLPGKFLFFGWASS